MKNFLSKFRIPTILGLGIITSGIIAGVTLTLREQNFLSKASVDILPQNATVANISESEVNISWQTSAPAASFLTFGLKDPLEQTVLDDRDSKTPMAHSIHFVTIKNLLPKTPYQYKIISGKISSDTSRFETATPLTAQTGFRPVIGTILDGNERSSSTNKPLTEGIAYLSIDGAITQAALIKSSGNFLISISQIRNSNLSDSFPLTADTVLKLNIVSANGQASALFKLKDSGNLPPIKLGENLDLTLTPSPYDQNLTKYDLNGDGKINAKDNAIILQNFEKKGRNIAGDLNGDGIVDQKDLDLMSKQINQ